MGIGTYWWISGPDFVRSWGSFSRHRVGAVDTYFIMALRKGFKKGYKRFFKKRITGFGFKGRGRGVKAYAKYSSPAMSLIAALKRAVAVRSYGDRKSLYAQHKAYKDRR